MTLTDLILVFALSLLASLHCAQMCGPIVLSFSLADSASPLRSALAYNAGRILTYTALGAAAGLLGAAFAPMNRLLGIEDTAAIAGGALMLIAGLGMFGALRCPRLIQIAPVRKAGQLLRRPGLRAKCSMGALMGFLPCGLIYAAVFKSLGSGSAALGAAKMLAFGLGTAAPLLALGAFSQRCFAGSAATARRSPPAASPSWASPCSGEDCAPSAWRTCRYDRNTHARRQIPPAAHRASQGLPRRPPPPAPHLLPRLVRAPVLRHPLLRHSQPARLLRRPGTLDQRIRHHLPDHDVPAVRARRRLHDPRPHVVQLRLPADDFQRDLARHGELAGAENHEALRELAGAQAQVRRQGNLLQHRPGGVDVPRLRFHFLLRRTARPLPSAVAYRFRTAGGISGAVVTLIAFADFAFLRQRFCTTICPYGYLQGMLGDKNTLLVHYRDDKHQCIECKKCVRICHMGIDIRRSPFQIECIHCGECVDACNEVLARLGKPGLIQFAWGEKGEVLGAAEPWYKKLGIRDAKRAVVLAVILCYAGGLALALSMRKPVFVRIAADRTVLYKKDAAGDVVNTFRVVAGNRSRKPATVQLSLQNLKGAFLAGDTAIRLQPSEEKEERVDVTVPAGVETPEYVTHFRIQALTEPGSEVYSADTTFIMPRASGGK